MVHIIVGLRGIAAPKEAKVMLVQVALMLMGKVSGHDLE